MASDWGRVLSVQEAEPVWDLPFLYGIGDVGEEPDDRNNNQDQPEMIWVAHCITWTCRQTGMPWYVVRLRSVVTISICQIAFSRSPDSITSSQGSLAVGESEGSAIF